jgi:hypothetical protein
VRTRFLRFFPGTNLPKVLRSFDGGAALTPGRVVFATGEVFGTCPWTCFEVDAVGCFVALEVPWGTPFPTVPAICLRPSWT